MWYDRSPCGLTLYRVPGLRACARRTKYRGFLWQMQGPLLEVAHSLPAYAAQCSDCTGQSDRRMSFQSSGHLTGRTCNKLCQEQVPVLGLGCGLLAYLSKKKKKRRLSLPRMWIQRAPGWSTVSGPHTGRRSRAEWQRIHTKTLPDSLNAVVRFMPR